MPKGADSTSGNPSGSKRKRRRSARIKATTAVRKTAAAAAVKKRSKLKQLPTQFLFDGVAAMGDAAMRGLINSGACELATTWSWESPELLVLKAYQKNPPGLSPYDSLDVQKSCYVCRKAMSVHANGVGAGHYSIYYGPLKSVGPSIVALIFYCDDCESPNVPESSSLRLAWRTIDNPDQLQDGT